MVIEIDTTPDQATVAQLMFPTPGIECGSPPGAHAMPSRLRILAVDDDPLFLKALSDVLQNEGHKVTIANGGQAGLFAFRAAREHHRPFDVVITDLGMPYVDGRIIATLVKAESPLTPVILLTGRGQQLAEEGGISGNMDKLLNKPPKLAELREALAEISPGGHELTSNAAASERRGGPRSLRHSSS